MADWMFLSLMIQNVLVFPCAVENLQWEFDERFADFEVESGTFQLFGHPFPADVESIPSVLQN